MRGPDAFRMRLSSCMDNSRQPSLDVARDGPERSRRAASRPSTLLGTALSVVEGPLAASRQAGIREQVSAQCGECLASMADGRFLGLVQLGERPAERGVKEDG